MKKVLMWLGGVFLLFILVGVLAFGFVAYRGTNLDHSSKAYVEEAIPKILASWDAQELMKRASPELKKIASDDQVSHLFAQLQGKLGTLKASEEPKGDSLMSWLNMKVSTTAKYAINATFDSGTAVANVGLVLRDGEWRILSFHLDQIKIVAPVVSPAPDAAATTATPDPAPVESPASVAPVADSASSSTGTGN